MADEQQVTATADDNVTPAAEVGGHTTFDNTVPRVNLTDYIADCVKQQMAAFQTELQNQILLQLNDPSGVVKPPNNYTPIPFCGAQSGSGRDNPCTG